VGSTSHIRVLLRDTPTMLRDILERAISHQPDMEVIPEPEVPQQAADRPVSPDVVVVNVNDADPGEGARTLLRRWPDSHVLTIAAHGQRVLEYRLLPRGVDLGEMSPDQLVAAIRSAVRLDREPDAD
jgi:DNA-binding NarL/FixJ family response regulator